MSAPRGRVEEGNDSERLLRQYVQSVSDGVARHHLRFVRPGGVQPIVDAVEKTLLQFVAYQPVDEIAALVLFRRGLVAVVDTQGTDFLSTLPLLNLPSGHVGIDQQRLALRHRGSTEQRGGRADDDILTEMDILSYEVFHPQVTGASAEQTVVGDPGLRHLPDLSFGFKELTGVSNRKTFCFEGFNDFADQDSLIALDDESAMASFQLGNDLLPSLPQLAAEVDVWVFVVIAFSHDLSFFYFSLDSVSNGEEEGGMVAFFVDVRLHRVSEGA